ncbi:MAG: general secretion pathway protein GspD [Pirellulaceae bacterium]|nr:general secretion pathway protein GspD [Pirellulaceae bacterium]
MHSKTTSNRESLVRATAKIGLKRVAVATVAIAMMFSVTTVSAQSPKQQATTLLSQAKQAMQVGNLEKAEGLIVQAENLRVQYDPLTLAFEYTADKARNELNALRGTQPAMAKRLPPVAPVSNSSQKQQALAMLAAGKAALDRGDLVAAEQNLAMVTQMNLPNNAFGPGELQPWALKMEIDNAKSRLPAVRQAARFQNQQGNVAQGIHFGQQGHQNVVAASANGTSNWQNQATTNLSQMTDDKKALADKVHRQIMVEQAAADEQAQTDPRGAYSRLEALRANVEATELPANVKGSLVAIVDRNMKNLDLYIQRNRAAIIQDEENQMVLEDREREQKNKLRIQQRLADYVDNYNRLQSEGRYAEANMMAEKARELDPHNPVVVNMYAKGLLAQNIATSKRIQEESQRGVTGAFHSVDASAIPFDDSNPIRFTDEWHWRDLTEARKSRFAEENKHLSPAGKEIRRLLDATYKFNFQKEPLGGALKKVGELANINIYIDPEGLAAEGITTDTPVTLSLARPIMLRSGLNLILEPLGLSYVIDNEVLKITSNNNGRGNNYTIVYPVGDLVIPIPSFVDNDEMGLPAAMRQGYDIINQGHISESSRFAENSLISPVSIVSNPSTTPAGLLAQVQGGRGGQAGGFGGGGGNRGGGLGGGFGGGQNGGGQNGNFAQFDELIQMIQNTVNPDVWDDTVGDGGGLGGDGLGSTINQQQSTLSLVINTDEETHRQIAQLLEQLRRLQDLQVTVEVRFITLNDNFFERMGIDFDLEIDDNVTATPEDDSGPSITFGLGADGQPTADLDIAFSHDSFGASVPQFGGFDAGTAANFGFAILSDIEVFFLLQAAQGDQRTNVMQAPKVTMYNGQAASINDTTQRPFVTSLTPVVGDFAAAHQPVISVLSEGTQLNVQAVVSADRRFVRLTMVPVFSQIGEVNTFTFSGTTTTDTGTSVVNPTNSDSLIQNGATTSSNAVTVQLPSFASTSVQTTVSVPDGGTILLGGIKRLSEGRNERGVPMLSKLPYINRLFKNVGIGRTTQSLMLMVTPRIIIQEEEEERLGLLN